MLDAGERELKRQDSQARVPNSDMIPFRGDVKRILRITSFNEEILRMKSEEEEQA